LAFRDVEAKISGRAWRSILTEPSQEVANALSAYVHQMKPSIRIAQVYQLDRFRSFTYMATPKIVSAWNGFRGKGRGSLVLPQRRAALGLAYRHNQTGVWIHSDPHAVLRPTHKSISREQATDPVEAFAPKTPSATEMLNKATSPAFNRFRAIRKYVFSQEESEAID
jgi:hypothetical protein